MTDKDFAKLQEEQNAQVMSSDAVLDVATAEEKDNAILDNMDCASEDCANCQSSKDCKNSVSKRPKSPKVKDRAVALDILKCTLVLVLIAGIAGILLGVINWATYVDPDGVIIDKVAQYFEVDASNVQKSEELGAYDNINACFVAKDDGGAEIGYCYYSVGTGAKDGTLTLLVYIGADGIIKEIVAYEQGETAGYFKRVEDANKSKYVGLDTATVDELVLVKNKDENSLANGEINAVSQATRTSTGYHNAIAAAVNAYKRGVAGREL